MYIGKDFEDDFKGSFNEDNINLLTRLYDTTNGYAGVKNPCDFILWNNPYEMNLELKKIEGNRLPFADITDYQWQSLSIRDKIPGMMAGILICFYNVKRVFFVPMTVILQVADKGLKSIHWKDCERYGIELQLHWKRTHFTMNIEKFMEDCKSFKYNFKITEVVRRA